MVSANRGVGTGGSTLIAKVRGLLEETRQTSGSRLRLRVLGFISAYRFWKAREDLRRLHDRFLDFQKQFGNLGMVSESDYLKEAMRRAELRGITAGPFDSSRADEPLSAGEAAKGGKGDERTQGKGVLS